MASLADEAAPAAAAVQPAWLRRALADIPRLERLPEPLERSAPLGLEWAETHCGQCKAYHGLWQYRRITGGVAGGADGAIYQAIVARLVREEGLRHVLISATADYALQALVRDGFRAAGRDEGEAAITVIDRCKTPLLLNRWLAAERGAAVETRQGELLRADLGGPYDLAISHSLFYWFTPAERPLLAARWFAALRPGGRVLLSNRISQNPIVPAKVSTPALLAELRGAAERLPATLLPRLLELAADLHRVWSDNRVESVQALTEPFAAAGFEIEAVLVADDVLPAMRDVNTMPGKLPGGGKRHLVVARRPG